MKQSYSRCSISMVMLVLCLLNVTAQITLHEATGITQTKATLSADFPELNAEHGFQYKYGSLPEIDDFSKLALSPQSDLVQINNNSLYAWSARSIKGWIESNPNVEVNKESKISVNTTIYHPSNLTFEWSVDSEINSGILSLFIDGVEIQSISGFIDFESVSLPLSVGNHNIVWSYRKNKPSNIGLDLGMLRNISILNTTPYEWIESQSGEIDALYPSQKYLYRAFNKLSAHEDMSFSPIREFETLDISFSNLDVNPITQTKATLNFVPSFGDANADYYFIYGAKQERHECNRLEQYLLNCNTTLLNTQFSSNWDANSFSGRCVYNKDSYTKQTIEINVILTKESTISFQWLCYGWQGNSIGSKTSSMSFLVDGVSKAYISNAKWKSYDDKETVNVTVSEGVHKLIFETNLAGGSPSWPAFGGIWNLDIPNTSEFSELSTKIPANGTSLSLENLHPQSKYAYYIETEPNYISQLPKRWEKGTSQLVEFETLGVTYENISITNITQASATASCSVNNGDATILSSGFEFKELKSDVWSKILFDNTSSNLCYNFTRLKPDNSYTCRFFTNIENLGEIYSAVSEFSTLPIVAYKPEILKVTQHQAILTGKVISGNANIYQRGMQFRKKGMSDWEEVEDGGNESIYTLVKKNLEMGATYEARTYVQPAGCDIIYSDILEFTTLDFYFTSCNSNNHTQTTVTFAASLADTDEDVEIGYGFEYYISSDGFFENADNFIKSDIVDIPITPIENEIKTIVTGLCPGLSLRWRAYAVVNGDKVYYTGSKNQTWTFAGTDRATIKVSVQNITQTTISLNLDTTQDGDAVISQIEYALANSLKDTDAYSICDNSLTLTNLTPDKQYNIRFRGKVNNRLCPMLKDVSWDYSWFEYKTLQVTVNVQFSNISQCKATMNVSVNSGDASVSNLRYRLNYGEIESCAEKNLLTNLSPEQTYRVTIFANVNGEENSWDIDSSGSPFKFTTKSVSSSISINEISQTSAKINWTSNFGDATFVTSGLEIDGIIYNSEEPDGMRICTELLPNTIHSCRSFVETEEGGRVYSSSRSFTTESIICETLPVSNISNRSATMNGSIECDDYSSAEFGFQWKQMQGWQSNPAFTKGRKLEDGTISVSLANGMLEPNTDYQYRTAVRYQNNIYYAPEWQTFRTESEFVYYPTSVYTVFRTDRENNRLVLCGYYIAGSETIVSQGYEYWRTPANNSQSKVAQTPVVLNTDESMHYEFAVGELPSGNYNVRAFVKTESGSIIYGSTLGFKSNNDGYSGFKTIECDIPTITTSKGVVRILNAESLDCYVFTPNGLTIAHRKISSNYDELSLSPDNIYIIVLSNGLFKKIKL